MEKKSKKNCDRKKRSMSENRRTKMSALISKKVELVTEEVIVHFLE